MQEYSSFYIIQSGQIKNLQTSTLAFNIAQFFSLFNHQLSPLILNKAIFGLKISFFFSNFSNCLISRKTQYLQNNFISSFLIQMQVLKITKKFPISFLFFVNDGLLVTQNKNFLISNSLLFCGYQIISSPLEKFRLKLEHEKLKYFIFPDLLVFSISLPSICLFLIALSSGQKIHRNTQASSLVESYCFDLTSIFMPTKLYLLSNL